MKRFPVFALILAGATALFWAQDSQDSAQWPVSGHDLTNSRNQPNEFQINPANVHLLAPQWVFTTSGSVSATPTVFGDVVYFPDWGGHLYAVRRDNGQLIWSHAISEYDGFAASLSRVSPAVHGDDLILGIPKASPKLTTVRT
jgi:polyvinyl alcohol dehydrogenase (cytochrome)